MCCPTMWFFSVLMILYSPPLMHKFQKYLSINNPAFSLSFHFFFFFYPPPSLFLSSPLWRSRRNSAVCHCTFAAAALKTVHNYVIHRSLGETMVRRHRIMARGKWRRRKRGEGEMSKMHCRHASDPRKAHTRAHKQPQPSSLQQQ